MINITMFTSIFDIQCMRKTKAAGYGGFCKRLHTTDSSPTTKDQS